MDGGMVKDGAEVVGPGMGILGEVTTKEGITYDSMT